MGRGKHKAIRNKMKLTTVRLPETTLKSLETCANLKDMNMSDIHRYILEYGIYYLTRDLAAEEETS